MLNRQISRRGFMQLMATVTGTAIVAPYIDSTVSSEQLHYAISTAHESPVTPYNPLGYVQIVNPVGPKIELANTSIRQIYGTTSDMLAQFRSLSAEIAKDDIVLSPNSWEFDLSMFAYRGSYTRDVDLWRSVAYHGKQIDFDIIFGDNVVRVACASLTNIEMESIFAFPGEEVARWATMEAALVSNVRPEWVIRKA